MQRILSLFYLIGLVTVTITFESNVSFKPSEIQFITSFCLNYDSINDLISLNKLLKSRLLWGGEFASVPCVVVAFIANSEKQELIENHYSLWIFQQLRHIVTQQGNCSLLMVDDPCLSIDSMIKESLKKAQSEFLSSPKQLFYVHSPAMIFSDPLLHLRNLLRDDRRVVAYSRGSSDHIPSLELCECVSFLLPSDLAPLLKKDESLCHFLNSLLTNSTLLIKDMPVELRYSLMKHVYSNPAHPIENISVVSMASGADLDISLVQSSHSPDNPSMYAFGEALGYDCDLLRLSLPDDNRSTPDHPATVFLRSILEQHDLDELCYAFFGEIILDQVPLRRIFPESFQPITLRQAIAQSENDRTASIGATRERAQYRLPLWMQINERNELSFTSWDEEIYPWIIPCSKEVDSLYSRLVEATRPRLLFYFDAEDDRIHDPNIIISDLQLSSKCSIIYFASGFDYFLEAYEAARRVLHYHSLLSYSLCESPSSNILLYTSDDFDESYWESHRHGNASIPSFHEFVSKFTAILQVSRDPFFLNFIPSNRAIFQAMHMAGQDGFHHSPLLFWQRMSIFLHLPSQYNLFLDSDVVPCIKGFESAWLELKGQDLVSYVDPTAMYGGTNREKRFPFPSLFPTREWIQFPERLVGFLMIQQNDQIAELGWRYLLAYRRQLEMMVQGRTFIRGDLTAFREALFSVRKEIRERTFSYGDFTFCLRPWSYFAACTLYHATDRYERCPISSVF